MQTKENIQTPHRKLLGNVSCRIERRSRLKELKREGERKERRGSGREGERELWDISGKG